MVVLTKNLDMLSTDETRKMTTTSSTVYAHRYTVPTRGRRRVTSANGHMGRARARACGVQLLLSERRCCLALELRDKRLTEPSQAHQGGPRSTLVCLTRTPTSGDMRLTRARMRGRPAF